MGTRRSECKRSLKFILTSTSRQPLRTGLFQLRFADPAPPRRTRSIEGARQRFSVACSRLSYEKNQVLQMTASDHSLLPMLLQPYGREATECGPMIESGTGVALVATQ